MGLFAETTPPRTTEDEAILAARAELDRTARANRFSPRDYFRCPNGSSERYAESVTVRDMALFFLQGAPEDIETRLLSRIGAHKAVRQDADAQFVADVYTLLKLAKFDPRPFQPTMTEFLAGLRRCAEADRDADILACLHLIEDALDQGKIQSKSEVSQWLAKHTIPGATVFK